MPERPDRHEVPEDVHVHVLGDPDEAREHFTPDRMAQAKPRDHVLDESEPPAPATDRTHHDRET